VDGQRAGLPEDHERRFDWVGGECRDEDPDIHGVDGGGDVGRPGVVSNFPEDRDPQHGDEPEAVVDPEVRHLVVRPHVGAGHIDRRKDDQYDGDGSRHADGVQQRCTAFADPHESVARRWWRSVSK
jgi:hypothetical protein